MLIGNYTVLNKSPGRSIAGSTVADTRPNFNQTNANRNRFFRFDPRSGGAPAGALAPTAWILPQKAGGMSSDITGGGVGGGTATISALGNLTASGGGEGGGTALLLGAWSMTASGGGAGTGSASLTPAADPVLTASSVATAIWGAAAASFIDPTTMGGRLNLVRMILQNKTTTDPDTGTMTVFADDGVTPAFTASVFEDVAGSQPYRSQGADRRDALA